MHPSVQLIIPLIPSAIVVVASDSPSMLHNQKTLMCLYASVCLGCVWVCSLALQPHSRSSEKGANIADLTGSLYLT